MISYAKPLARLVGEFEKLPGIGPKSAQRLAFYVRRLSEDEAKGLADAILEVKARIGLCRVCYNFTDQDVCEICRDSRRTETDICVVADPRDLIAIEKTGEFRGKYRVLGGVLAPMDGSARINSRYASCWRGFRIRRSRSLSSPPTRRSRGMPPLCTFRG